MNIESRLGKLEKKTNASTISDKQLLQRSLLISYSVEKGEDESVKRKEAIEKYINDEIKNKFNISYEEARKSYKKYPPVLIKVTS